MKNSKLFTLLFALLCPLSLRADDPITDPNVNERYLVESVAFTGIDQSQISDSLRGEAQQMVGEKYNEQSAKEIAKTLRKELRNFHVEIKVEKGDKPENVKVVFELRKKTGRTVGAEFPLLVYHSKEGFSASLEIPFRVRKTVFTFGMLSDADQLLERNSGFRFRFEQLKIGSDRLRLRLDFDTYHQKFNAATESELLQRPDIPGIYRTRQNFAPSLQLLPASGLSISTGLSFQRLQFQYPGIHTDTAYAGTADVRYHRSIESPAEYRHEFDAAYSLDTATRILDSDLIYTRHLITGKYTLSKAKHFFSAGFLAGRVTGQPPLFERFSLGNSATLRGWNKFDVTPLGGSRAAHGSLEYRYHQCGVFYDVGTVWEPGLYNKIRHGIGFGWASKHHFVSLAFPVRLHDVSPVFMFGIR